MTSREAAPDAEMGARARNRFARLRTFIDAGSDVRMGLGQVAKTLASTHLSGRMAVVIDGQPRALLVDLDKPEVAELEASNKASPSTPDLIVVVKQEVLTQILRGTLSPLDAFLDGDLRYAGNEDLGVQILRELAISQDSVFEPCRDDSW